MTPSSDTTAHMDFSKHNGTRVPMSTPLCLSCRASLDDSLSSSLYVRLPSQDWTATASGCVSAISQKRSCMQVDMRGGTTSFQLHIVSRLSSRTNAAPLRCSGDWLAGSGTSAAGLGWTSMPASAASSTEGILRIVAGKLAPTPI